MLGAAVASWLAGAVWYTVPSKAWLAALGVPPDELKRTGLAAAAPFIISFVAEIVMVWTVYGLIGHIGQLSLKAVLLTGGLRWLGFMATTAVVNNAGHWLAVLLLQGAIIGAFALR